MLGEIPVSASGRLSGILPDIIIKQLFLLSTKLRQRTSDSQYLKVYLSAVTYPLTMQS